MSFERKKRTRHQEGRDLVYINKGKVSDLGRLLSMTFPRKRREPELCLLQERKREGWPAPRDLGRTT